MPSLKERSYIKHHSGNNKTHDLDREKVQSIVLNLVYDPSNPEMLNDPILNRRKEQEPKVSYDKKSLYLCGQSDRDLSQLVESKTSVFSNQ